MTNPAFLREIFWLALVVIALYVGYLYLTRNWER